MLYFSSTNVLLFESNKNKIIVTYLILFSSTSSLIQASPGVSRVRFGSSRRSPNSVLSRVGSFRKSNSSISKEERRYAEREAALAEEE